MPLYASLPYHQQLRVFDATPPGTRKVILATNVAETSITISGVKYVVDTGMVKQRTYNPATGMDFLAVCPVSKAQVSLFFWEGGGGRYETTTASSVCNRTTNDGTYCSARCSIPVSISTPNGPMNCKRRGSGPGAPDASRAAHASASLQRMALTTSRSTPCRKFSAAAWQPRCCSLLCLASAMWPTLTLWTRRRKRLLPQPSASSLTLVCGWEVGGRFGGLLLVFWRGGRDITACGTLLTVYCFVFLCRVPDALGEDFLPTATGRKV